MPQFDPEKEYLLNVKTTTGKVIPDIVLYGKDIPENVRDIFTTYSEISKVYVYDNETKDAVHIYRK